MGMLPAMPELPEVETVRRGLAEVLPGRRLVAVELRRADLRRPFPPDFARRLTGRRVIGLDRRAKYILVGLEDGLTLILHLGMSGRVMIDPPKGDDAGDAPGPHDHVLLTTDEGRRIVYRDPRRFGLMDLADSRTLAAHPLLAGLGPEPLADDFTAGRLAAALAGRSGPIKTVLLDQKVVAGIGNIYASEALFRAGIDPGRPAAGLPGKAVARLTASIRAVLEEAIDAGGSSLRDHRRPDGELGYFQHLFKVYDREGEPCEDCDCRTGIRRIVQAGRATFYCAKRQI